MPSSSLFMYVKDQRTSVSSRRNIKRPIVNQQNAVYHYKCGLCDTDYVGLTSRHLHQRVEEQKRSTIGYHVKDEHGKDPNSFDSNFEILKKCQSSVNLTA